MHSYPAHVLLIVIPHPVCALSSVPNELQAQETRMFLAVSLEGAVEARSLYAL